MQDLSSAVGLRRRSAGARVDLLPASQIEEAVWGRAVRTPELSAAKGLWRWQKSALADLAAAIGCGAALAPEATLAVLFTVMAVLFLFVVALRCAALWHLLARPARAAERPHYWEKTEHTARLSV